MRMAAEKEIINNFAKTGFGVSELKQKTKNLPCTYNQECLKVKKYTKSGAGADDKHTNALQQTNIEGQSLNLDATSLANEHTNDDSIISQALRFI
ncbi:hypothetical protein FQA39_LY16301 [Lamprigera yunnana]|nr:hypothetical protein FQA39_LY16301 [Lamprigera yunnana]